MRNMLLTYKSSSRSVDRTFLVNGHKFPRFYTGRILRGPSMNQKNVSFLLLIFLLFENSSLKMTRKMDMSFQEVLVIHWICFLQFQEVCFRCRVSHVYDNFFVAFCLIQISQHLTRGMVQLHLKNNCIGGHFQGIKL